MKIDKILEAEHEAKRFLKRITEARKCFGNDLLKKDERYELYGTKESGAIKRASLDLSMALVSMRKS